MMKLPKIKGIYKKNFPLSKATWFQTGGKAEVLFIPKNISDLKFFLQKVKKIPITIIGGGSNLLVRDKGIKGIAVKLGEKFSNISKIDDTTLIAGAGTTDKNLSEFAMLNEITGFEFLSCIPGTVGGGIKMNSGCFENEFKDIIISVQALDEDGRILSIPKEKIKFSYRNTDLNPNLIYLSATFKGQKS